MAHSPSRRTYLKLVHFSGGRSLPLQYEIFNVVNGNFIFSMNTDGYFWHYCREKNTVLQPHGIIPANLRDHPKIKEIKDDIFLYELDILSSLNVLLPRREPKSIINNYEYYLGERLFKKAKRLIIMGYSFGRNDDTIDDQATFDWLVRIYQTNPVPVYIVDPSPEIVKYTFQSAIKSKRVYEVPLYWDAFSPAFLELYYSCRSKTHPIHMADYSDEIAKRYTKMLISKERY